FDAAALSFPESTVIAGLMTMALFGDSLVVLAYIPSEEDKEKEFSSSVPSRQAFVLKVYVIILVAEDHINWLLQHGCHEKALAVLEARQGRSELLDEGHFRVANNGGPDTYDEEMSCAFKCYKSEVAKWVEFDHINWLLQHGCHEKALAVLEVGQGRSELLDE
nr:hypothetical protein [Tanacetum cinerariifolium]